ncbi:transposase [Desulfuromonas versatilis]|uniref:transposase n=1 Tax=Desulfuromonas versatilis TaxID=2802975 RepID=UPI001C85CF6E
MDCRQIEKIKSEAAAKRLLSKECWNSKKRICPRCSERKIYKLLDKRYRCKGCGYTFHDFTGRWINKCNLSCLQWIKIIGLFESECSILGIAKSLKISYNTAYKAVTHLRLSILSHSHNWQQWASNIETSAASHRIGSWKNAPKETFPPVFGAIKNGDQIISEYLPCLTVEDVLSLGLRLIRRNNLIYSSSFENYHSIFFYGLFDHENFDSIEFSRVKFHQELHDFWRYVAKRLCVGVSANKFPLFYKEIEYRYNNKGKISEEIVRFLCDHIPETIAK